MFNRGVCSDFLYYPHEKMTKCFPKHNTSINNVHWSIIFFIVLPYTILSSDAKVTSHSPIFVKFSPYMPVYNMMMLWKFQVILIIFNSPRLFRIFLSFNMEGYGGDLLYPQSSTFDQPLRTNHLQWRSGWPIVGSVLSSPSIKYIFCGPLLLQFFTLHIFIARGAVLVCRIKIVKKYLFFVFIFSLLYYPIPSIKGIYYRIISF